MGPKEDPARGPTDPAFAGEILGAFVSIRHPGLSEGGLDGTLVDETLRTLVVRSDGRLVRVPKSGVSGTILLDGRALPLRAEDLRTRPEDRTKRVASRGRRR